MEAEAETLEEKALTAVSERSNRPKAADRAQQLPASALFDPHEEGEYGWLQRALGAEREAVAKELEKRHRLLIAEIEQRLRQRAPPAADAGRLETAASGGDLPGHGEKPPASFHHTAKHNNNHLPGGKSQGHRSKAEEAGHSEDGPTRWTAWTILDAIVTSYAFEWAFGALILLNTFIMCLQVQYDGMHTDYIIRYSSDNPPAAADVWPGLDEFFGVAAWFFGISFTVEVVLKIMVFGRNFWRMGWNLFDFIVVFSWLVDKASAETALFAVDPMLLRFCRLARLLRLVKAMRFMQMFDALQVLIASIKGSLAVLFWSTLLLFAIMMVCAMVLSHFLQEYMLDDKNPEHVRHDIYRYFGSFSRGMVTMLELTLGNWVPVCRLLMENLMEWYGFAIVIYKIMVGFGVVKVITGCFLHETFKIASTDDEIMIMRKQREQESHRGKMERLFSAADDQGHGTLSREEFAFVLSEDHVKTWLSAMEISFEDANMLFELIASNTKTCNDNEEPRISVSEFLQGTTRLRGNAKALDMWQLLTLSEKLTLDLRHLKEMVSANGRDNLLSLAASTPDAIPEDPGDGASSI